MSSAPHCRQLGCKSRLRWFRYIPHSKRHRCCIGRLVAPVLLVYWIGLLDWAGENKERPAGRPIHLSACTCILLKSDFSCLLHACLHYCVNCVCVWSCRGLFFDLPASRKRILPQYILPPLKKVTTICQSQTNLTLILFYSEYFQLGLLSKYIS
jgi:hypothetical protein